jgi:hypothetical protein
MELFTKVVVETATMAKVKYPIRSLEEMAYGLDPLYGEYMQWIILTILTHLPYVVSAIHKMERSCK